MPDGFVGKACQSYLEAVNTALSAAHGVHIANAQSPPSELNLRHRSEDAMYGSHMTGAGNCTNIVVDQNAYTEALQKMSRVDAEVAEDLHRIANEIEKMCDTIFIVPETLCNYKQILNQVRSSLDEFQSLTEQTARLGQGFVDEMMRIDCKRLS
jgi:hypothetical protein